MASIQKIYAVWVYAKDIEQSKKFYEQILGLKTKLHDGGWIEFDTGETVFAILQRPKEKAKTRPQKTRIMFQTDDLETMEKRLKYYKVIIISRRIESYGQLLTFEDPDGHWLELFEPLKKIKGPDPKHQD